MKYTVDKLEGKVVLNFSMTVAEWDEKMERAYDKNKHSYSEIGFRKGHVPRKVLEAKYGKGMFFEDALYDSANDGYRLALTEHDDIIPVASPSIEEKSISNDGGLVKFALSVIVKPEVTLGKYKGLKIEKSKVEVSDEELETEIKKIQERNARLLEITDRAILEGDEVILDYSGSVNGVKFDGGTAEKQSLTIGSHTFIPGFEEQLIGLSIGDIKDISVKFPDEYFSEELKGKEAIFNVTIHEIKRKDLPLIDDEFAKDVSEFNTLVEYKEDIKANLLKDKQEKADIADENKLLDVIVSASKINVPQEMIEEQIEDLIKDFEYQLSYQGMKLDDYLKYTKSTRESLKEQYKERAEKTVRTRLVLEKIVALENISPVEADVEKKITAYATDNKQDPSEFKSKLTPDQLAYFENQDVTDKLLELLKKENTIA
ncbi:MAG: trigger factor [Clostridia bacterium]